MADWRAQVAAAAAERSETASGYVRVNCPACIERAGKFDRDRSLSVNMGNGWWLCHRCEYRGRLDGFEDIGARFDEDAEPPDIEQPSDYQPITRSLAALTRLPHRYLRARGVPATVVREALLGYAMRGDHRGRIIMPVVAADDWRSVGWVGRDVTGKQRRYHVSGGIDNRATFYNDDQVGAGEFAPLLVMEGPFDVLAHWPHAVGCMGKPREGHLGRLGQIKHRPVVLLLDGDAWRESLGWAQVLRVGGVRAYTVRLPPRVDAAELPRKVVDQAVAYCLREETDTELG